MSFRFPHSSCVYISVVILGVSVTIAGTNYCAKADSLPRRSVLVKTADNPTIYYINAAGIKKPILNEKVFLSYGNRWENVLIVPPEELKTYTSPDGIRLAGGDGRVYILVGNQKRLVTTPAVFQQLGLEPSRIVPVNRIEFNAYATASPIDAVTINEGDIFRTPDDYKVYIAKYVGSKKFKRWFIGPQMFDFYLHLSFAKVKVIDPVIADSFTESKLIRPDGDQKVYYIGNAIAGTSADKEWIPSLEVFQSAGFDADAVYTVNLSENGWYQDGRVYNYNAGSGSAGASTATSVSTTTSVSPAPTPGPLSMLSVIGAGSKSGTITANTGGINCGSICSDVYAASTTVVLTANPDSVSLFDSWTNCPRSNANTCTVVMGRDVTVTVIFENRGAGGGGSPAPPAGVTYYVDAIGGDDANGGISQSSAWKTIAKVNSSTFNPGEQILFKRGDTWTETLTPPSSGASGKSITFGAYGIGTLPIIDATGKAYGIQSSGKSYLVISNLQVTNPTNIAVYLTDCTGCVADGINMRDWYAHGIYMSGNCQGAEIKNSDARYTTTGFNSVGTALIMDCNGSTAGSIHDNVVDQSNVSTANHPTGILCRDVLNCQVYRNTISMTVGTQAIGIKAYQISGDITGAQVYDNQILAGPSSACSGCDGEPIELTGNSTTQRINGAQIYRNFIVGGAPANDEIGAVYQTNTKVWGNILFGAPDGSTESGIHFSSLSNGDDQIYNNTLYNFSISGIQVDAPNESVRNNLISKVVDHGICYGPLATGTWDYNIINQSGPACANQGIDGGHNLTSDPKFAVATPAGPNDVKLQSGSPAIDSGTNLGNPYNFALDPVGTTFPYLTVDQNTLGSGWERGAFAYR